MGTRRDIPFFLLKAKRRIRASQSRVWQESYLWKERKVREV
jgi:hypothetical protein